MKIKPNWTMIGVLAWCVTCLTLAFYGLVKFVALNILGL